MVFIIISALILTLAELYLGLIFLSQLEHEKPELHKKFQGLESLHNPFMRVDFFLYFLAGKYRSEDFGEFTLKLGHTIRAIEVLLLLLAIMGCA